MRVVDASAVVRGLASSEQSVELIDTLLGDEDLHAPHLVDVEVTHALRRLVAIGALGADRAADARLDLDALPITRYPHPPLLDRAWQLRENLSVSDAVYVALAELLGAPLLTCDAHIASAPGHHAQVELFPP